MKSLEEQLATKKQKCIANGRTADQIAEAMKPATIEEKLSAMTLLSEGKKIVRNNGGNFVTESIDPVLTVDERIARTMREKKCSFREASIFITGKDPGKDAKQSKSMTESLTEKWEKFCPLLSHAECVQLAERGVEP